MVKTTTDRIDILKQIVEAVEGNFSNTDLENNRIRWKQMDMQLVGHDNFIFAEEYTINFTIKRDERKQQ